MINFDYLHFLTDKKLRFNVRYIIKERNFKLKIEKIPINEDICQHILNQIKKLEKFDIGIEDSKKYYYQRLYVDFIKDKVKFTIKTQETSMEVTTNKIATDILINFYEKLMKNIKKFFGIILN